MEAKKSTLIPYFYFDGNCEEALNFYKDVLNGKIGVINRYDNPSMNVPEHYKNKVLHARLHFGDNSIYASDLFPGQPAHKTSGDVALSLSFPDPETGKQVFGALSQGGEVGIPF